MVKIFIDPGHGGTDSGAVGNGIQEKNVTLQIGLRIRDILERDYSNVSVRMSRTGDTTVSLNQRSNAANSWGADFLYSVHVNSGGGVGYEDYIYSGLSSTSRTAQMQRTIHSEIMARNNMNDRGTKKADFHMLRETSMDAVLTENGFIDNAGDAAKMKDPAWIESVARGHVVGLEKIYNLTRNGNAPSASTPVASPTPAPSSGRTVYLPASADTWRIYNVDAAPVRANAIGQLRPSKFGGLSYRIVAEGNEPYTYIIDTADFGRIKIYAHPNTGAVIK
ncbi:N-acetylmuramoyl-L-alanine amidase [Bacillus sp. Y1]|nr:N-acetylmuramoyl-L-alanine amidase [Bacillus sp. Y1]AYA78097.1 N-acetylmuramoyl-L-alanine amidase [Bacillus sp. Y1]